MVTPNFVLTRNLSGSCPLGDGNITCSWCYYVIYLGKGYRRSVGGSYPITSIDDDEEDFEKRARNQKLRVNGELILLWPFLIMSGFEKSCSR